MLQAEDDDSDDDDDDNDDVDDDKPAKAARGKKRRLALNHKGNNKEEDSPGPRKGKGNNVSEELLNKSVAAKKLGNHLKTAILTFKKSPYAAKPKVKSFEGILDSLERVMSQIEPAKIQKCTSQQLEQLHEKANNKMDEAKQTLSELKKIIKMDTDTQVYSTTSKKEK